MMGWLSTAWRELIGLFIDDGSLALAILAWLLVGAVCIHVLGVAPIAEGLILTAGFALLLAENVERTARAQGPPSGSAAAVGRVTTSLMRAFRVVRLPSRSR
jgi:hypothetical protein